MSQSTDIYGFVKPRLRGVIHTWSILPFALAGVLLVLSASTRASRAGALVYVLGVLAMFSASAAYHRLPVEPRTRTWLRRLDHSMIGVTIAGTYTPVILMVTSGATLATLLIVLWSGALLSILVAMAWPTSPRAVRSGLYVTVGLSGAAIMPWLLSRGGVAAFACIIAGAVVYIAGAVVYALRRPNPVKGAYEFHEVFHTLVTVAVACQFAGICAIIAERG
jgi:hemolysin III